MTDSTRRLVDLAQLGETKSYHFLISAIVPRPIAWVSTRALDGTTNLAPFSFFQGVSADPPIVMLSIARHKDSGEIKDTLANIEATSEFVVNLVPEESFEPMVESSAQLRHGESEIDHLGLATFPATRVAAPCLVDSPVNFECRLFRKIPVGGSALVLGEILVAHVLDSVLDARGVVDAEKLRPVARLGGSRYLFFDPRSVRRARRP